MTSLSLPCGGEEANLTLLSVQSGLGLITSTRGLSLSIRYQGSGQKDPEHPSAVYPIIPRVKLVVLATLRSTAQF
ncbi:hypothetical protein SPRA44_120034 [Serratia proteamaculans]|nr:hypothetical protein SPRA44_120034 [Serratia proteamaculans]